MLLFASCTGVKLLEEMTIQIGTRKCDKMLNVLQYIRRIGVSCHVAVVTK